MLNPKSKQKGYQKLKLSEFKLNALLEVTKAINENLPQQQLFGLFETILRDQLAIGKLILFTNNRKSWHCELEYGTVDTEKKVNVKKDLLPIHEITVLESSADNKLSTFDIVIPVYHKEQPLAFVLLGDLDEKALKISPIIKHMPFIQTLANIIVVAIENKRLAKESIRQEGIRKELELASEMQAMLFPEKLPDNEQLQISALYQPHQQVGGDYYDYITLNGEEIAFCMADVSGKGMSAALLMANFQANLRAMIQVKPSLTDLVKDLNDKVMSNAKGEKFITLFIAKYNLKTRQLNYINSAHNPPLLKTNGTIIPLKSGCTGIGMFKEIPEIEEGSIEVPEKSVLLCYTDGVVELENVQKEPFGAERLKELLLHFNAQPVKKLNEKLINTLDQYRAEMPYIDDIALFSCRFF